MARGTARRPAKRLRLKPANPFDLIRLLAQSQSDPRKAVAELVQNSLDAQARRIDLTWFTEHRSRAVRVLDDGEGIFPDLDREDALRRIATTIGHSHKRQLTPAERKELMAVGKYGIGLLGFWAVGKVMEIRSRVDRGETWCLRLREDEPQAELARSRARRLDELTTFTEVTVLGVHGGVERQLRPKMLHVYLAAELRGQLLRHTVDLRIHDRVARGRAPKQYVVKPQRFRGRHLPQFRELGVAGCEAARLDLYLVDDREERQGRVVLACAGSTVLDDLTDIDGLDEPRAPWDSGRFEGVVDFPELEVAPGTRRGFRTDEAAVALREALPALEAQLADLLAEEKRRRKEERDRNLAKEIRKVFRPVARRLPEYDLFDVRRRGEGDGGGKGESGAPLGDAGPQADPAPGVATEAKATGVGEPEPPLFPPGPLASVRIEPAKSRLPLGARRNLRARGLDADGRPAAGAIEYRWARSGPGALENDAARAVYTAPDQPGVARVMVTASQGATEVEASAGIRILEDLGDSDRAVGIPEPVPVHVPTARWRSRVFHGRWEYNTAHRDYEAVVDHERQRLRYLIHLFAKEVVLHNFGHPAEGATLERMVEVLTYLGDARRPPPRGAR